MEKKKIIWPLQRWLLHQHRCVGCGQRLEKAKKINQNGQVLVSCTCQRIFVWEPNKAAYRRALLSEVK